MRSSQERFDRNVIELRRLQQFVAVVECGSLTDAAALMNQSQQALSVAIKSLEGLVGAQLFERSRGMRPTPAGRKLYESTKVLLAGADRLVPEVRRLAANAPEVLRIGHTPAVGSVEVFDMVSGIVPDSANVQAKRLFPPDLETAVMTGEIDIALRRGVGPPAGLDGTVVGFSKLNIAVASDDPLAQESSVSLRDLEFRTLILWSSEARSNYAKYLANQFRAVGVEPKTRTSRFQGLAPAAAPLAEPGGFAMVAADPGEHFGGRITVVGLCEPVQSPVQAVWLPTTRTGLAGELIDVLVELNESRGRASRDCYEFAMSDDSLT